MRRKTIVLAAVLALAPVAAARAQSCMGSIDLTPMQVGGELGSQNDVTSLVGQFGMSTQSRWFGNVGIGTVSDNGGTVVGFRAGRQVKQTFQAGKISVCPVGSFAYQMADADLNISTLKLGAAFGGTISKTPTVAIRPTGAASIARYGVSMDLGGGANVSDSEIGLMLDLGVGFVFNGNMALVPSLSLPIGFDFLDESLNLAFTYGFGGRTASAPASRPRR